MRNILQKQIFYRATHRGGQEADRILGGFVENVSQGLSDQDLKDLSALLDNTDLDVFTWIDAPDKVPVSFRKPILQMLRDYVDELKHGKHS